MADYSLKDLIEWDAKIRDLVERFGLDCFPQEFEICDHGQMLGYMAYSGMPSHYRHWSYGKAYERLKTLYDHGVSGLPYEMVINSNPSIAYLMRDNSLLLQILTMAHVYAHNDFFKNNFTFRSTRPDLTVEMFKAHAMRVRRYIEDPSIGIDAVEHILDAAHALALQCRRNLAIRKLSREEQVEKILEQARPRLDPFRRIHRPVEYQPPDLQKVPLEPEEDILLFIRDHNPQLTEWEKDLLTIVDESTKSFIPLIETKIMNEGWATFWHKRILEALDLDQGMRIEFIIRHNQVVRPIPGQINPYHLGLRIWEDLYARNERSTGEEAKKDGSPSPTAMQKIFQAREADRDTSFVRRYLTPELMRELDLFKYEPRGHELVVTSISDDEGWEDVKESIIKNIGMNTVPVIKVEDADFGRNRVLYLKHYHDGRDLQLEHAEKTLAFVYRLWGRECILETAVQGRRVLLVYNERGFSTRTLK